MLLTASDGLIYGYSSSVGKMVGINVTTGLVQNSFTATSGRYFALSPDDSIYKVDSSSGNLIGYDISSGVAINSFFAAINSNSGLTFGSDGLLYGFNSGSGNLIGYDVSTGTAENSFNYGQLNTDGMLLTASDGLMYGYGSSPGSMLGIDVTTGLVENSFVSPGGKYFALSTVVPIPAAVWLFGSGLGLLGWMKRKATAPRALGFE